MVENTVTQIDAHIETDPIYHVVFLHQKLRQNYDDAYLADLARALERHGHKITVIAAEVDQETALDHMKPTRGNLSVECCGRWIPSSVFGWFRSTMTRLRAMWMTVKLIVQPPSPMPKIVILDVDTIALLLLRYFSSYKTIYIHHFPQLHGSDIFHCCLQMTPDLLTAKTIGCADEIIVQTKCLQDVFRRSFPRVAKAPHVFHPCVDTGLWLEGAINIRRIIPDLPENYILFVTFGEYRRRSNFRLVLDALEHLYFFTEDSYKCRIHLVVAGHCSERSATQQNFYADLLAETKDKSYAAQVTFLKQLPTVHKKTLIKECTAVVHPTRHDIYPGPVLAAMSLGRPVIAVNCGFANEVLMHRLTGVLVEPDPFKFAKVMHKIATSPTLEAFLGDMAKNTFCSQHTFDQFSQRFNALLIKTAYPKFDEKEVDY